MSFVDRAGALAKEGPFLYHKRQERNAKEDLTMLSAYLTPQRVIRGRAATWQEALTLAGQPLLADGSIQAGYLERCADTLKTEGPYMVIAKGIALCHSRPGPDVGREALSLLSLEEPVAFGHPQNDPVQLVFLLGALSDQGHITVLMELAQALSQPGKREELFALSDPAALYQALCPEEE